jgi:hypothetical protein
VTGKDEGGSGSKELGRKNQEGEGRKEEWQKEERKN